MAPCSYVNEHAKEDISSLLYIKRKKSGVSSTAARLISQQNRLANSIPGVNPVAMSMPGVMVQHAPVSNYGNISQFALSGGSIPVSYQIPGVYQPTLQEQLILAQLQQAHTSAASAAGLGLPQYVQCAPTMASLNQGLLTSDQGQVCGLHPTFNQILLYSHSECFGSCCTLVRFRINEHLLTRARRIPWRLRCRYSNSNRNNNSKSLSRNQWLGIVIRTSLTLVWAQQNALC